MRLLKFCGLRSEPLDEHLTPPGASDKRYETPELNDDVEMFQKLWAEEVGEHILHEQLITFE